MAFTLDELQRAIDAVLDRDICEICGALKPYLSAPQLPREKLFEIYVLGGCEHHPPEEAARR